MPQIFFFKPSLHLDYSLKSGRLRIQHALRAVFLMFNIAQNCILPFRNQVKLSDCFGSVFIRKGGFACLGGVLISVCKACFVLGTFVSISNVP